MARKFWLAAALFVLAFSMRITNAPQVFVGGFPRIAPVDDLYHWKRMTFSAAHFPQVLELDRDRGVGGAFCPWPPLYDLSAGAFARLFGARQTLDVLQRVIWIPPFVAAICVALTAFLAVRPFGLLAGSVLGIALSTSPFLVTDSSIGNIDHHWLEWPLTFAILGSVIVALRGRAIAGGVLLALSIVAAMFVQTALLIACGLAFVVLFAASDGTAAAIGFSAAAVVVAAYRLTRLPGYPDNPWFLGWAHVALFAAAAVAGAVLLFRRNRPLALACGIATVFAIPTAPASILAGTRFFGGQRWLQTIVEFQPMWKGQPADLLSQAAGLSAGLLLVWILAAYAVRRRDAVRGAIALYAILYLLLTISSRRFWSVGIPLLALAGAVSVTILSGRRRMLAAAAVALIPAIQLALWLPDLKPPIEEQQMPWIRTALFLQRQPRMGRVLAPWSIGHVLDVIGERAVVIDNFGTMPDSIAFGNASDALLSRDEDSLARYCDRTGVRYLVIDNPLYGLRGVAAAVGIDPGAFVQSDAQGRPVRITRLAEATWWWRAYFGRGRAVPAEGIFGRPFTRFRLAWADPQPSWHGTAMYRGPALEVWEYVPRVR